MVKKLRVTSPTSTGAALITGGITLDASGPNPVSYFTLEEIAAVDNESFQRALVCMERVRLPARM